ncbi:endonuclease/exonuclease/phosphatase family protein [Roseomonas sp. HF4]|uniref:endonuclease/exonuclease/phosphatase family protein n=1 Tax=Roseomonas sp. HF4 TaxID=2562313 RepID=UPI0010BF920D|nr:endonuclease/exonuclease/phosphatase family protein [Roseomonas sp. HF4]
MMLPTERPTPARVPALPRLLAGLRDRLRVEPPARRPVPAGALAVASYNIHKCVGTDNRFDPARVAAVIAELDADILALQEADRRFGRRHGLLDMPALERRTGLSLLPLSLEPGGHGWRGNALLVRNARVIRQRRLVLPGGEPRGAVMAELDLPAGRLCVVAAHFGLLRRHRAQQAMAILAALAEAEDVPTLVFGDLNEWRPGPRSSLRALEDGFGGAVPGPATFPSRLPVLALDRILGRPRGLVLGVEAHDTPRARVASDHLPIRAVIDLAAVQAPALAPALSEAA